MVANYRRRLEQALKFKDVQTLAEVVFEIKSAELEEWFNLGPIEDLIYAD
jgi:hypothetical protein